METIEDYLAALASERPTPGGGSAAAIVGAQAAALVAMVARVTLQAKRLAAGHDLARAISAEADLLRDGLHAGRAADERAYGAFVAARTQPTSTEPERTARALAMQAALAEAAAVPLAATLLCRDTALLALRALDLGNESLASDLGCAAEFANAAAAANAYTVRANHAYLADRALIEEQGRALVRALDECAEARARMRAELSSVAHG